MPQPVPQGPLPTVPIPNFLGLTADSEQGQQQRGAAGQDTSGEPGSGAVGQGEHGSAGSRGALLALGSARSALARPAAAPTLTENRTAALRSQPRRAAQELRPAPRSAPRPAQGSDASERPDPRTHSTLQPR